MCISVCVHVCICACVCTVFNHYSVFRALLVITMSLIMGNVNALYTSETPTIKDYPKKRKGKKGKKGKRRNDSEGDTPVYSRPAVDTTAELPEVSIRDIL